VSRGWLAVFAKAPRPGRVKTRLSPPLSLDQAAALYDAMLSDVLEASFGFAGRLDLDPVLYFDPPDAHAELAARAPRGFRLLPQLGAGLAERMANAFVQASSEGVARVILRGSDSPGLEQGHLEDALARLDCGDDVVLTPDQSGGYALIALKEPRVELFEVVMSTRSVLEETLARARSLGLVASLTRPSFDLDQAADFPWIDGIAPARSSVLCPRTVEMIWTLRHTGVL